MVFFIGSLWRVVWFTYASCTVLTLGKALLGSHLELHRAEHRRIGKKPRRQADVDAVLQMYAAQDSRKFLKTRTGPGFVFEDPLVRVEGDICTALVLAMRGLLYPKIKTAASYQLDEFTTAVSLDLEYKILQVPVSLSTVVYLRYSADGKLEAMTDRWNAEPLLESRLPQAVRHINSFWLGTLALSFQNHK